MDEKRFEKQAKRAKRWDIFIFSIFTIIVLTIITAFGIYKYQHTFTCDKWNKDLENRFKITANMLERHHIIGMTESNIIELLGEEDGKQSSFKMVRETFPPESTLVYYLGVYIMDSNWLIISMENNVAISYCIDVT